MPFLLLLVAGCDGSRASAPAAETPPAPVAVAQVETRTVTLRRTFSGALEAAAEIMVAPRVPGQLVRLALDIGDRVEHGATIARLDDARAHQDVLSAEAELMVARANREEAVAAAEIAERAFDRVSTLHEQEVASATELDAARTTALARRSRTAVTDASIKRAEAALEAARIRLAETQVVTEWNARASDADTTRYVGERFVDEGAIVQAGEPIVSVVALDPMVAVIFVPERDYAGLSIGRPASIETDAYPRESFEGTIARIAPVFSRATRQVRVELEIENSDLRLKPGMFVRATLELDEAKNATVVPYAALTSRAGETGLFSVSSAESVARWHPVRVGIREDDSIQVTALSAEDDDAAGPPIGPQVVVLGQEMCDDGAPVRVIESEEPPL